MMAEEVFGEWVVKKRKLGVVYGSIFSSLLATEDGKVREKKQDKPLCKACVVAKAITPLISFSTCVNITH